jgi:hypothetical protein
MYVYHGKPAMWILQVLLLFLQACYYMDQKTISSVDFTSIIIIFTGMLLYGSEDHFFCGFYKYYVLLLFLLKLV